MIRSMTGFGRGRGENSDFRVQAEIRSVNHRYLDVRPKLPFSSPELEARVRDVVSARLHRGKVDLSLVVEETGERGEHLRVNRALIKEYLRALRGIQDELGLEGSLSVDQLAGLPWGRVFEVEDLHLDEADFSVFDAAVSEAVDQLLAMREREGEKLQQDLRGRLEATRGLVAEMETAAEGLVEAVRNRLEERTKALLHEGDPDPGRIMQEAAILADRSDISEELTRLHTHLDGFAETMDAGGAVGKKLDFLLQECHRETNTIGSKGRGTDLPRLVVDAKAVIEAMREQVQNLE